MIEGGYLKNMAAISGGLEKFGIKNNFSSTPPPSNLNYDWSLSQSESGKCFERIIISVKSKHNY